MDGVFTKCQDCQIKPATIKFTKENQERKVCYNCQKKAENDPSMKEWKKEIIPYSELKKDTSENRGDQSRYQSSAIDTLLKSPEPSSSQQKGLTGSILRNRDDKLSESILKSSSKLQSTSQKRLSAQMENTSPKVSFVGLDESVQKPEKPVRTSQQLQSPLLLQKQLQSPVQPQRQSQALGLSDVQAPSKFDLQRSPSPMQSSTLLHNSHVQSGSIRHNTSGKKYIFFSEYLKDYDPSAPSKFQSPGSKDVGQRDIRDKRASVDDARRFLSPEHHQPTKLIDSFREHERNREKLRLSDFDPRPTDTSAAIKTTENQRSDRDDRDSFRKRTQDYIPDRLGEGSHKSNPDEIHKKVRDFKKEEIRAKLNKLSEKLYSPMKSSATAVDLHRVDKLDDAPSFENKESRLGRKEISTSYVQGESSSLLKVEPIESDSRAFPRSEYQNRDSIKYKQIISEHEMTIANLKAQIDGMEKKHADIVNRLQEELREARERSEFQAGGRSSTEIRLNERIRELERNWQQELARSVQQEEQYEQSRSLYEKKIHELREELEKLRDEKDEKIQELMNQIKNLNKTHRDTINKMRIDHELALNKIKDEQNFVIKDLTTQLEKKNAEVERLKKEKNESIQLLNEKNQSLQEALKHFQETNDKRFIVHQTIELKNEEIRKLTRRVNDVKNEFSMIKNEVDLIDHEKDRLREENEKLRSKVSKLDKMVYG